MRLQSCFVTCVTVAGLIGGCASPNYKEGEATSGALKATAAETVSTQDSIDSALTSLRDLVNMKEGDLRPRFEVFSKSVDRLEESVSTTRSRTDAMTSKANSYLARWDSELKQVKTEDLRARSLARRTLVQARVKQIGELTTRLQAQAEKPMANLTDIRRVLSTDLTQGGVVSVRSSVAQVETACGPLRETAIKLNSELKALSDDLSTTLPAAPAATAPAEAPKVAEPTK